MKLLYKNSHFDLIILGGGHAGCEAAYIASQFGINVAIVSMKNVPLASCPCNPAVGGVGKGQVVLELDMLGGLMPKLADLAGIQYRTLNESKGHAIRSTRAQVDKDKYSEFAEEILESVKNITIIRDKVNSVTKDDENIFVLEADEQRLSSDKLVVTTGTFLNGKLHCGEVQNTGGRVDCESSLGLEDIFANVKTLPKRFKTGTPPRLDRKTVDYSKMVEQKSDDSARSFHWKNRGKGRNLDQVSCFITHTNEETMKIIRENKERSPIFNGQIEGIGPRYCPSIEDKAYRYLDRNTHHVFVEPEGHGCETLYPNGISSSLPAEVQSDFLRTIDGLENAEVLVPGYAVEYDVVDTSTLRFSFEHKEIEGLFFAGQVNGTSGYEEAAGQGFIAGVNATLSFLNREPLYLSRNDSYIGVMIEDLVTQKRDEPYRLFTARSENRLFIREDNTFLRISPYRNALGLNEDVDVYQDEKIKEYRALKLFVSNYIFKPKDIDKLNLKKKINGGVKFTEIVKIANVDAVNVLRGTLADAGLKFSDEVVETFAIECTYDGYIKRNHTHYKKALRAENSKLDYDFLMSCKNISFECKERIKEHRPITFGQLKRIEGIRPASLVFIASQL